MADRLINAAVEHLPGVVVRRDGKHRRVSMDLAAVPPTYPTAVAACFGASLWPLFAGSSYESGIREALAHVIGRTRRKAVFKHIDRKFCFLRRGGELALTGNASLLDETIEAVLLHRCVSIDYTRFGGAKETLQIEPLSIVVHDHQLYVVGRQAGKLHPYRFARMQAVDILDSTFVYPPEAAYDPTTTFRDSFGIFLDMPVQDLELRLDSRWAHYAQIHRWHDSQVVEVRADHVSVKLHVGVCPELEAWILGFGEHATVVAPRELRERIAARVRALAVIYGRDAHGLGPALRKAAEQSPHPTRSTGRRKAAAK